MKLKHVLSSGILLLICIGATAQTRKADSLAVLKTFKEMISLCKNINWGDPKTLDSGYFYKVAPYIVYHGDDEKRNWRDFTNYSKPEEKKLVDVAGEHVNNTVNHDSNYVIKSYHSEKESEGTWHVLTVSYMRKGKLRTSAFAFLKIGKRFALGDID